MRDLWRNHAVPEISGHQRPVPLAWIAVSPPARQEQPHDVARAEDDVGRAGRRDSDVVDEDLPPRGGPAAKQASGREAHPSGGAGEHDGGVGIEPAVIEGAQRQLLAEPAAPPASTARVHDELAPLEKDRRLQLRPLDRDVAHVIREAHGGEAVHARAASHPAERMLMQRERLPVALHPVDVELPRGHRAGVGGDAVGRDLGEDPEHQLRDQHAGGEAPEARGRVRRIDEAALRCCHREGPVRAFVVGPLGIAHHLERHRHVGARVVERRVHGAADLGRGPGEVRGQLVTADRHGERDGLRLGDALDLHRELLCVPAVREPRDAGSHPGLGATEDLVGHRPERGERELPREPLEPARADPARRHLGAEVADHLLAEPHVPADQREEILVGGAGPVEAQRRDDEALLKDLFAQPRAFPTTDVHVMHAVDREAEQPVADEGRGRDEDVRGLAVAEPRVVADEDVAGLDGVRRERRE